MSEMVERVARAIYGIHPFSASPAERTPLRWDDLAINIRVDFRAEARAAIAAMREPTREMLDAARDWSIRKNGMGVGDGQAIGCWQAMNDEAGK
jgi:metal-dependent amidase/aminoacylase/carboxypeptidase family protein